MPLTTGKILDRIFRLLRANFLVFLRIAIVPAASMLAMYGVIGAVLFALGVFRGPHHPPDAFRLAEVLLPVGCIAGLAFGLIYALFEAAGTYAALQANLGVKVSFHAAYRVAMKKAGRYLWLMILRQFWIGLPILTCYAIIAGVVLTFVSKGMVSNQGIYFAVFPLVVLMYLGSMVYAMIAALRLSLALPACIAENAAAAVALRRSLALTRNAKGRIFVVMLAIYAAGYVAMMAFEMVGFAVAGVGVLLASVLHLHVSKPGVVMGMIVLGVVGAAALFLWIAALAAGYTMAFAVLYHDQRLRVEGIAPLAPAGEPA
jgi:hypothetical protein